MSCRHGLRSTRRWKDGKEHTYWSIVENRRCRGERIVQQTVLYLGEINDSQRAQWIRAIQVFDEDRGALEQIKLFGAERPLPEAAPDGVQVRLRDFELHRPRQWGACWLFTLLWKELGLESFGDPGWVARARAPTGSTCSRRCALTGCWIRAASGGCTGCGSITRPWATCSVRTSRLRPRTPSTGAWIGSWNTKGNS